MQIGTQVAPLNKQDQYVRDPMDNGQQIAIVLKNPYRLMDACRCAQTLMECGADVSFYCFCPKIDARMQWEFQSLLATCAPCFTDNRDLAARYHLACLPFTTLAVGIASCDWVIPI